MDQKEPPKHKSWGEESRVNDKGGGRPLPPRASSGLVGSSWTPPNLFSMPKIPINIETPRNKPRWGVPPPQASIATKNQWGARSGILPEGETITGGHLHHPCGLHDEEGVVHPRG